MRHLHPVDGDLSWIGHAFTGGAGAGPGATSFAYGHDAAGKTTAIGISQPAFEWMPTLAYARAYGAANVLNQVSSEGGVGIDWNADGNMTSDGVNTYAWTYGNRMSGASRPGMTATYDYDAEDRRTRKTVDGVVTRTLWSGADELGQYDGGGLLLRRFVPDGTGAMDARLATVTSGAQVYWHHTDPQGSVIATSDSDGRTVETATYSPHGEFGGGRTAPPAHSPFGYTGREFDVETGLYQYRARYYSPRLAVFASTDPIGSKDDPNLYMYVGLDPVNATDPTGMIQDRFDQLARRRDIGDEAADRQNRQAAGRLNDFGEGAVGAVNELVVGCLSGACQGGNVTGQLSAISGAGRVGALTRGGRAFETTEPLTGGLATAIDRARPGVIQGVNTNLRGVDGVVREIDIVTTTNVMVQVKSGVGRGIIGQMQATQAAFPNARVIGYVPGARSGMLREAQRQGLTIYTERTALLAGEGF